MEELQKELENLQNREFMLKMCDNWNDSDYRLSQELHNKILEIKNKMKELNKNEVK